MMTKERLAQIRMAAAFADRKRPHLKATAVVKECLSEIDRLRARIAALEAQAKEDEAAFERIELLTQYEGRVSGFMPNVEAAREYARTRLAARKKEPTP